MKPEPCLAAESLTSICIEILEQMGSFRKKFPQFLKYHEAYAYIKKEINEFEKIADSHKEISEAEIILCENCGSTYADIYGRCPFCDHIMPGYNPEDIAKLTAALA